MRIRTGVPAASREPGDEPYYFVCSVIKGTSEQRPESWSRRNWCVTNKKKVFERLQRLNNVLHCYVYIKANSSPAWQTLLPLEKRRFHGDVFQARRPPFLRTRDRPKSWETKEARLPSFVTTNSMHPVHLIFIHSDGECVGAFGSANGRYKRAIESSGQEETHCVIVLMVHEFHSTFYRTDQCVVNQFARKCFVRHHVVCKHKVVRNHAVPDGSRTWSVQSETCHVREDPVCVLMNCETDDDYLDD